MRQDRKILNAKAHLSACAEIDGLYALNVIMRSRPHNHNNQGFLSICSNTASIGVVVSLGILLRNHGIFSASIPIQRCPSRKNIKILIIFVET